MIYNDWNFPISELTFVRVVTSTDNSEDFASMICTLIDLWAEDHEIDKVKYAAKIADMVKRKVEKDGNCK